MVQNAFTSGMIFAGTITVTPGVPLIKKASVLVRLSTRRTRSVMISVCLSIRFIGINLHGRLGIFRSFKHLNLLTLSQECFDKFVQFLPFWFFAFHIVLNHKSSKD